MPTEVATESSSSRTRMVREIEAVVKVSYTSHDEPSAGVGAFDTFPESRL